MWTKSSQSESLPPDPIEDAFERARNTHDRLSFRPREAVAGFVALMAIVFGVLLITLRSYVSDQRTALPRMLSAVVLVFGPAILAAIGSLIFERSKVFGCAALLLAGLVLLKYPFTWYWLRIYWPVACAFTLFCAAARILERRAKN